MYMCMQTSEILTKHPYVTGCGEASEVDGLRCHPFDW